MRALGDNAIVVLGNHDLHLLALAHAVPATRKSDTLDEVLRRARSRGAAGMAAGAARWRYAQGERPDGACGLVPQWTVAQTLELAREVQPRLRNDPRGLFEHMYGDEPDRWSERCEGTERLRFAINVLTRLRVCTAEGRVDLKMKGAPPAAASAQHPGSTYAKRASRDARVIFGHWSALGFVRAAGTSSAWTPAASGAARSPRIDLDRDASRSRPPARSISASVRADRRRRRRGRGLVSGGAPATPHLRRLGAVDARIELQVNRRRAAGADRQVHALVAADFERRERSGAHAKPMRTGQLVPSTGFRMMLPELLAEVRSTSSVLRFQYCGNAAGRRLTSSSWTGAGGGGRRVVPGQVHVRAAACQQHRRQGCCAAISRVFLPVTASAHSSHVRRSA